MKSRLLRQEFRRVRIRRVVQGEPGRPRLSVYRSLKHIYAQLIDDVEGKTVAQASSREKELAEVSGVKAASTVGELLGKRAIQKGVKRVVFDRGGRPYHGQVKAVAEGARQAGLEF
jgi:large subunit ribosomal protein L18